MQNGRVVIVAGGIARPYFTHDTAAVSVGLELDCEVVLKATKVDGVYDKDPAKFPDAKLIPRMTLQEAVVNQAVAVMDKAALGLALEQREEARPIGDIAAGLPDVDRPARTPR